MSSLLTNSQRVLLEDVLNHIIPSDVEMPAAGQAAIGYVESEAATYPSTRRIVLDILSLADSVAGYLHNKPFFRICNSLKEPLLKAVEEKHPRVFGAFVTLAYSGYYTNELVINKIGSNAGAPQPKGFPVAPFDPDIVRNTRKLGPRYRLA